MFGRTNAVAVAMVGLALIVAGLSPSRTQADPVFPEDPIVIDPDEYPDGTPIPDGTVINDAYSAAYGVTLSVVATRDADPAVGNDVVARADSLASTSPNVFGFSTPAATGVRWYPDPGDGRPTQYLRADFDVPIRIVEITIIGNDPAGSVPPTDVGALWAYDSEGNFLDIAVSDDLLSGVPDPISITRPTPDIAYVLASGYYMFPETESAADNVHLDRLRVSAANVVPEPFSLAFLGSAFVGVVGWRLSSRRRQLRR